MKLTVEQGAIRRGLVWFSGLGFLVAGAFLLWNPDIDAVERGPVKIDTGSKAVAVTPTESRADKSVIARANIFSASRTPPAGRYNPAVDEFGDVGETVTQMTVVEMPPPQLFGTVMGPAGALALMQGDSAAGPGRLYREGEKIGAYRLLKVKSNSVIVNGPSGRLEIPVQLSPTGAK